MKPSQLSLFVVLFAVFACSCKKKGTLPAYDFSFPATGNFVGNAIEVSSTAPEGTSVKWNFGDKSIATGRTATHKYLEAGNYLITMTIENSEIVKKTISVAGYGINVSKGPYYPFGSIAFTCTAPSNHKFFWDFGDGTTSTEVSPSHSYSVSGIMTVNLLMDDLVKISGKYVVDSDGVVVSPASPSFRNVPLSFKSIVSAGTAFEWYFGDGTTSKEAEPLHTYKSTGHFDVSIKINGINMPSLHHPLDIYLYPDQASTIAGTKLWHHVSYALYPDVDNATVTKIYLADTSFDVTYVSDLRLIVQSDTLYYARSIGDSLLHYDRGYDYGPSLEYNINTHAIHYSTKLSAPNPSVGHSFWINVNDYDTP